MPGHPFSAHMCPVTLPVPKCARAPFRCSYVTENHSGANICPGTHPAPICVWAPYVPVHTSSAYIYLGTILVPICARALLRCLYVPWAPFRFPYVPLHPSGAHMCSGTLLVPICVQAHFRSRCVPGHNYGAHM